MNEVVRVLVSLAPVLLFLVALFTLDSFRLIALRRVLRLLVAGAAVAAACLVIAVLVLRRDLVEVTFYSRYLAPVIEELGKALPVLIAIRRKRVGFMVDAAIVGFATGAGFAATENIYFLVRLDNPNLLLWFVRGVGTAVMHGSTTAIVGIVSQAMVTLLRHERMMAFAPGLAVAVVAHSAFNHLTLSPLVSAAVVIVAFSALVAVVFDRSEKLLRQWLEVGLGTDMELLEMLRSGELRATRIGTYLRSLTDRFPGEVLADMFCYLLVMVELSIKAKVALLARETGLDLPADPEIRDRLTELRFLERSIGTTGRLALAPFLHVSSRDLWQLSLLESEVDQRRG